MYRNFKKVVISSFACVLAFTLVLNLTACKKINPKAPEVKEFVPPKAPKISSVNVPINIPISKVKSLLEKNIPRSFNKSWDETIKIKPKIPLIGKVKIAQVTIHLNLLLNRDPISFSVGKDSVHASCRAMGRIRGRKGSLRETMNLDGTLGITSRATLTPDWKLSMNSDGNLNMK